MLLSEMLRKRPATQAQAPAPAPASAKLREAATEPLAGFDNETKFVGEHRNKFRAIKIDGVHARGHVYTPMPTDQGMVSEFKRLWSYRDTISIRENQTPMAAFKRWMREVRPTEFYAEWDLSRDAPRTIYWADRAKASQRRAFHRNGSRSRAGSLSREDFRTSHLRGEAKKLAEAIKKLVRDMNGEEPDGGGCPAFITPAQSRRMGGSPVKGTVMVLVFDGGDLAPYMNPDYENKAKYNAMQNLIRRMGYWTEYESGVEASVYKRKP